MPHKDDAPIMTRLLKRLQHAIQFFIMTLISPIKSSQPRVVKSFYSKIL